MSNKAPSNMIAAMSKLKKEFLGRFSFITDVKYLPKREGVQMNCILIELNNKPGAVFQLLEDLIDQPYIDIHKQNGTIFVDDKINWEFYFQCANGFINIHDWQGCSVKITSVDGRDGVKNDAEILRDIIEKGIKIFPDYKKELSKATLESASLNNFLYAMGSLFLLYNHSKNLNEDGLSSLLESLMLLVAIIDTQLRYLILLSRINTRRTRKVDPDLLPLFCQQDGDTFIPEREIIKLAKNEVNFDTINKTDFFKQINKLYDFRNRAVHRFSITSFQYSNIRPVLKEYENIPKILGEIIENLEHEQVDMGIGFLSQENIKSKPPSQEELDYMVQSLTKAKIDPLYGEVPSRTAMFSDKYEDGINPVLKAILDREFNK